MAKPRTLYDKIWDDHVVDVQPDGTSLIYIDRHLVHEVTSPQAFEGLRMSKRKVRAPEKTLAVVDHNVPTTDRSKPIEDPESKAQVEQLALNAAEFGVEYYSEKDVRQGIVSRLKPIAGPAEFSDCDVVVEAATENVDLKLTLFKACDAALRPGAILASNTSSISLTKLAAATSRPGLVLGLHFMNPPPLMKLVEIVRAVQTSDETYAVGKALVEKMGKTVVTSGDAPGFLVNRMLIPMLCEAIFTLEQGLGTKEDIDQGAKLGLNHPMGPLELSDLIGLDTVLFIADVLHRDFGDSKYRAPTLLRNLVAAGWLGRKTGRGFYQYPAK